ARGRTRPAPGGSPATASSHAASDHLLLRKVPGVRHGRRRITSSQPRVADMASPRQPTYLADEARTSAIPSHLGNLALASPTGLSHRAPRLTSPNWLSPRAVARCECPECDLSGATAM